jgi:Tol biopolymer transport system component
LEFAVQPLERQTPMEDKLMIKKSIFWSISFSLYVFACQSKIEPAKVLKREIPAPTPKTLIFLSTFGLPGWQIMYKHENGQDFRLSTGPFDVDQDWSWDKQWIVYVRGVPPQQFLQIWKMKYNGDDKTALTPMGIDSQTPAFSPDGRQIAFSAIIDTTTGNRHLVIINTNGGGWQQITTNTTVSGFTRVSFTAPTWFPDGSKVVVHFAGLKNTTIINLLGIVDLTTKVFSLLSTASPLSPWLPNLSPDGGKIAFVSGANGGGTDIFRVNSDGTGLLQLTNTKRSWEPDWSPDGKQIVFSQQNVETTTSEIWVMNADGTEQRRLIPAPSNESLGKPRW